MLLQTIGTISGVLNVILTARQNMWCWPVGIIYIGVSYVVFYQARLYAELASHTVFLILTIYGWWMWATKGNDEKPFAVTRLLRQEIIVLSVMNVLFGLLAGEVLH